MTIKCAKIQNVTNEKIDWLLFLIKYIQNTYNQYDKEYLHDVYSKGCKTFIPILFFSCVYTNVNLMLIIYEKLSKKIVAFQKGIFV